MATTTPTTQKLFNLQILAGMQAAVEAARMFEGASAPNPPVGCALLNDTGEIITSAAHQGAGQLHAEALAIRKAQELGRAADIHTVVVTLEPCNHQGRTPPCTDAILSTPAKCIVYGQLDPNPNVAGHGAERLQAAGMKVVKFDELVDKNELICSDLRRLIAPFRKRVTQGLPWVTVKQAINTSGNMLPTAGQKTFTSASSLVLAHQLRRRADVIVTGSGTILADNPLFTVRHVENFPGKCRKLIILDRRRRVPHSYLQDAEARGFEVQIVDDFTAALQSAALGNALEVLLEAGPTLSSVVLNSPHWDELVRITQGNDEDEVETILRRGENVLRHY